MILSLRSGSDDVYSIDVDYVFCYLMLKDHWVTFIECPTSPCGYEGILIQRKNNRI